MEIPPKSTFPDTTQGPTLSAGLRTAVPGRWCWLLTTWACGVHPSGVQGLETVWVQGSHLRVALPQALPPDNSACVSLKEGPCPGHTCHQRHLLDPAEGRDPGGRGDKHIRRGGRMSDGGLSWKSQTRILVKLIKTGIYWGSTAHRMRGDAETSSGISAGARDIQVLWQW